MLSDRNSENDRSQSYEPQRHGAGSTRDLGQKEAQIEKRSKEKLKHMGKSKANRSPASQGATLGQKKADRKKASEKKLRQM
jgi:hypothetical protein